MSSNEIRCPVARIDPSLTDETRMQFSLSWPWNDISNVIHGQMFCGFRKFDNRHRLTNMFPSDHKPIVMQKGDIFTLVTLKLHLKVMQGQRSWWTFTKWATVNIFVFKHLGPSYEQPLRRYAWISWPWVDPFKVTQGQFFCGFWKFDIDFPIVFHVTISHYTWRKRRFSHS